MSSPIYDPLEKVLEKYTHLKSESKGLSLEIVRSLESQIKTDPVHRSKLYSTLAIDALSNEVRLGDGVLDYIKKQTDSVNKQIAEERSKDPLTKLLNQRGLENDLMALFKNINSTERRFGNKGNEPGSNYGNVVLLFGDLNGFKKINDEYGHDVADKILQLYADAIRTNVRSDDIAARPHGGDEFIVVLNNCHMDKNSERNVVKIVDSINEYVRIKTAEIFPEKNIKTTISFGVAIYGENADDPEGLIRKADEAAGIAKERGSTCVISKSNNADSFVGKERKREKNKI